MRMRMNEGVTLGVIAGTSAFPIDWSKFDTRETRTPFDSLTVPVYEGKLDDYPLLVVKRHGEIHSRDPSRVRYRENIIALKILGATHILSLSAVGSLDEKIIPGKTLAVPRQIFDWTKGRRLRTFFDELAVHISGADPICPSFHDLVKTAAALKLPRKRKVADGTYVCIEGPQFSPRAESIFFKKILGAQVVGMTADPEWRLAREAGLCYAVLCFPSDYDSWRAHIDGVTNEDTVKMLKEFGDLALAVVKRILTLLPLGEPQTCRCTTALNGALLTNIQELPPPAKHHVQEKYGLFNLENLFNL